MANEPTVAQRADPGLTDDGSVTGVATGAVGTGTALDETQEWEIPPELQAASLAEAAAPAPDPAPVLPAPEPVAAPPAPEPVATRPSVALEPVAVAATAPSRSARTAGIAAAVLLALVAGAAVVGLFGAGPQQAPSAADQVTAAPTQAAPSEADGGGNSGGNGKGNNGNGNGKGNGNGND